MQHKRDHEKSRSWLLLFGFQIREPSPVLCNFGCQSSALNSSKVDIKKQYTS